MRTEASQAESAVEAARSEAAEEVRDGFFKHSSFVSHHVSAQIRGERGTIYLMLSLHLAETWFETNKECLKKPTSGEGWRGRGRGR